ncbi:LPS export ABC transporter periplasmic protein LptC [Candidatus Pelagibacter sp. Uisw_113]|uniref:LPS export ABC transporter periplasmic protein LptC n=1 Tax=Candidatus Pelagibacter sp. Uisw_113 TaxID=3230994 RepID=UPI0039EACF99
MKSSFVIQVFLLLSAIIISIFTVYYYFYKDKNLNISKKPEQLIESKNNNGLINTNKSKTKKDSNILENVEYENYDNEGNRYKITAEKGEIKDANTNVIYMKNVIATIYLKNLEFLTITSLEAIFDNENFKTNFSKNIELKYLNHHLSGENLNFLFEQNLITMENQVVYKNLDTKLMADRIVIDLITKNSKIFMENDNNKIKIFNQN